MTNNALFALPPPPHALQSKFVRSILVDLFDLLLVPTIEPLEVDALLGLPQLANKDELFNVLSRPAVSFCLSISSREVETGGRTWTDVVSSNSSSPASSAGVALPEAVGASSSSTTAFSRTDVGLERFLNMMRMQKYGGENVQLLTGGPSSDPQVEVDHHFPLATGSLLFHLSTRDCQAVYCF